MSGLEEIGQWVVDYYCDFEECLLCTNHGEVHEDFCPLNDLEGRVSDIER